MREENCWRKNFHHKLIIKRNKDAKKNLKQDQEDLKTREKRQLYSKTKKHV